MNDSKKRSAQFKEFCDLIAIMADTAPAPSRHQQMISRTLARATFTLNYLSLSKTDKITVEERELLCNTLVDSCQKVTDLANANPNSVDAANTKTIAEGSAKTLHEAITCLQEFHASVPGVRVSDKLRNYGKKNQPQ